jgi:hypothetical protein
MCGGMPKQQPQKRDLPPPAPPVELILDEKDAQAMAARRGKKQKRAGRSALVTPGLNISATISPAGGGTGAGAGVSIGRSIRRTR